ncbi:hypothetical protein GCM10022243_49010 [Saccharothrix violaceirubra]|uniref:Uncharacterized protein n=1 Tax=Saccharothrix violaceirubra TaxID=413306 RepID=A0A7W7SZD8_9PSEU|nr:hypothetical protein [Saccharothrix violaceirubra]MBB4963756.1 hypothetical protein [Saccharothrix violaceirubra]
MREMRRSIQPTYDSRETGPRYRVTYQLDDRTITFREPIADPFGRFTLRVSWWDRFKSLLRRDMAVTVLVDGDPEVMDDVLELDADTLVPYSTRQAEFRAGVHKSLARFAKENETVEGA